MKIALIGGARPNFMKIAPLALALKKNKINYFLVNTGQHFSKVMADDFFEEFGLRPDYQLKPKRYTVVSQLAGIMIRLEKIFIAESPDLVLVVGDVNSTLAAALTANKLRIKLAHVEAGLRSYSSSMPEEYNRVLTDHLADFLFVTEENGIANLKKEGITKNVHFVGNIMIDNLKRFLPQIKSTQEEFDYCTLHRAENVDNRSVFKEILSAIKEVAGDRRIYLPLHPRTKKMALQFGLMKDIKRIFTIVPPLSYHESLYYQKNAQVVLTDSGGIQEESSFLGTPCVTLRTETERPITLKCGTNVLGGVKKEGILKAYQTALNKKGKAKISYWDGKTSQRIIKILKEYGEN